MSSQNRTKPPGWIAISLTLAGIYNFAWGGLVIARPNLFFELAGIAPPLYPEIWQCVGMIVGVYGFGYLIAARDPNRHWPIVFVGLLGKILGPIGFAGAVIADRLPLSWGATILTNDVIWWIPFATALYYAWRFHSDSSATVPMNFGQAIRSFTSHRGATLESLSQKKPTLVVFLRHAGCTFCREALWDLHEQKEEIRAKGVEIAVVHMGAPLDATMLFEHYGMETTHRFSDPECILYDAFKVQRGTLKQVLGPQVWWRGLFTAIFRGHGMGPVQGDVFRMPGLFALDHGKVVAEIRADYSSDRPDYADLAASLIAKREDAGGVQRQAVEA